MTNKDHDCLFLVILFLAIFIVSNISDAIRVGNEKEELQLQIDEYETLYNDTLNNFKEYVALDKYNNDATEKKITDSWYTKYGYFIIENVCFADYTTDKYQCKIEYKYIAPSNRSKQELVDNDFMCADNFYANNAELIDFEENNYVTFAFDKGKAQIVLYVMQGMHNTLGELVFKNTVCTRYKISVVENKFVDNFT